MIRDVTLKLIFIPLLSLLLPILSGLVIYNALDKTSIFLSLFYFLFVSLLVWQLTIAVTTYVRRKKPAAKFIFYRVFLLMLSLTCFVAIVAAAFSTIWQKLFMASYQKSTVVSFSMAYTGTSLFIGLLYEILFLHKEIEVDKKVVNQLDLERQYAEMHVLKNELDPHFIFNSLTALSHLIHVEPKKALLFNNRLSQAYKYLLINKDRDLIPLEDELRFIKDYFFILQIRYDHNVKLEIHIDEEQARHVMILPCALQLLIENAIKHNSFTDENPLQIVIYLNNNQLFVANNVIGKKVVIPSTQVGLKNLSTRYRMICQKDISINRSTDNFLVKLPLIKPITV